MGATEPAEKPAKEPGRKRAPNPLCQTCNHPKTIHGKALERCWGLGCTCSKFEPPRES